MEDWILITIVLHVSRGSRVGANLRRDSIGPENPGGYDERLLMSARRLHWWPAWLEAGRQVERRADTDMEIHAPHGSAQSWREIFVRLASFSSAL
jgi:hypothetical protein